MELDDILAATLEALGEKPASTQDADVPADIDTILAATEKLLAVNRGVTEPDERDSLAFRRVITPDRMFGERVELDAGKLRRTLMRRLARQRSLKALPVAYFDPYAEGLVAGHQLSSPLEEINPLQLVEQARRITAMGPGGLTSDDQITPEAQSLHPSIFGFMSSIESPESSKVGIDTRLAWNARVGSDGQIYQRFKDRRSGKLRWMSAADLTGYTVGLPD